MADRTTDPIEGRARNMPQDQPGQGEDETAGHIWRGGAVPPEAGDDVRNEASRSGANPRGQAGEGEVEGHGRAWAVPRTSPVRSRKPRGIPWDEDSPPSRISKVPGGMRPPGTGTHLLIGP